MFGNVFPVGDPKRRHSRDNNALHTEPRAARLFLLASLSPRPGERCRYPAQWNCLMDELNPYNAPDSPSSSDSYTQNDTCRTKNTGKYIVGIAIAAVAGLVAAPMAFAFMWGWGDYSAGNISDFSKVAFVGALLAIGSLLSSFLCSWLLKNYWPVSFLLLSIPTILMIGGTAARNHFSTVTTVPILAVVVPAFVGGIASMLFRYINKSGAKLERKNAG